MARFDWILPQSALFVVLSVLLRPALFLGCIVAAARPVDVRGAPCQTVQQPHQGRSALMRRCGRGAGVRDFGFLVVLWFFWWFFSCGGSFPALQPTFISVAIFLLCARGAIGALPPRPTGCAPPPCGGLKIAFLALCSVNCCPISPICGAY